MMMEVSIWGMDLEVEFDENEIFACDEYEENVLVDGMWLAYDESICAWVMIDTEEQYWAEHTTHHQYN